MKLTVVKLVFNLDNIKQYYVYCDTVTAKYQSIANIYGTITIGQVNAPIRCSRVLPVFTLEGDIDAYVL